MCLYPLHLINYDSPNGPAIYDRALYEIERLGSGAWVGFSFAMAAQIYAMARQGNGAYQNIRAFAHGYVNDNGFQIVWRYFSWSNQTLAMIALWVATAYLLKKGKYRFGSLLTAFPAAFMTAVSLTYILMAQEGFRLAQTVSYIAGASAAVILFVIYLVALIRKNRSAGR